ncbi:MAG: ABC transporter permease, partial [Bacteroidota bacterium]|nr:ABC transporter permease [Bacteroidota bacterium]
SFSVFFSSSYSFGTELREGTATQLLETSNNSVITAVAGKMLPYTLVYFIYAMIMNFFLFSVVNIPLQGNYTLIILSEILLIIAYQLIAISFLAVSSNMRLTMSLGSAFTMMALTFAGLTFPYMAMPVSAKIFSHIFPYSYWLKTFLGQSLRGEDIVNSIYPLYYILIFIAVGVLSLPLYKKRLANKKYHGKI